MCISLDKLTEELHSVDEQLSQLKLLREVHSTSALAMALRKLNSSLLRQVADSRRLQEQVDMLEDERDEAWSQAQIVASELDDMVEASHHLSIGSIASMNSNRVQLSRIASERATKTGLRRNASKRGSTSTMASAPRSRQSMDAPPLPLPFSHGEPHKRFDLSKRSSRVSFCSSIVD
jgi:hypothetical protein